MYLSDDVFSNNCGDTTDPLLIAPYLDQIATDVSQQALSTLPIIPRPETSKELQRALHNGRERQRRATQALSLAKLAETVGLGSDAFMIDVLNAAIHEIARQQKTHARRTQRIAELAARNAELRSDPLVLLQRGNSNGVGRAHRFKVPAALRQLLPHNRCGRSERVLAAGKRRRRAL
jgi:hypothetical protein